jgi:ATP-binding cassette, subfamily C, bacterial
MPQSAQSSSSTSVSRDSGLSTTLRAFLKSLFQVAGRPVILAVVVSFLVSLSEGVGIALLLPLLQVAGFRMEQGGQVGRLANASRQMLMQSGVPQQWWLALLLMAFVLLVAVRSLLNRAQSVQTFSAVLRFDLHVNRQLYSSILNANWLFLSRRRSSDFTHALTGEMSRVDTATFGFVTLVSSAMAAVFYIALAMKLSFSMTLLVLAAGGLLVLVTRGSTRAAHESGNAISSSLKELYSAATEHLQNLKTIKALASQKGDLVMFTSLQERVSRDILRNTRSQAAASFWFEFGSLVVLGLVILISFEWLNVAPAAVLLLLVVFTRLMPRLSVAFTQYQSFVSELPAFRNVMELRLECLKMAEEEPGPEPPPALRQAIRLENVSFAYSDERGPVLDHLSLVAEAGRVTAILGSSGAGKSTAADLLNGLLSPNDGRVMIDATELTPSLARAWRGRVGYVAQDTLLFHDTVRANLLWAEPSASEEEMIAVLKRAAADFVLEMPNGLDSVVGDRGILLSNGQRQRIALARALLRKPSLLILDEATNSLDMENEKRILDSIHAAVSDSRKPQELPLTVIIIAHRASAIERADMVYLLEGGHVAASGTWESVNARRMELNTTGVEF